MNLNNIIGIAVAGNFAGHLEQAGESKNFKNTVKDDKPKGIFPFFLPKANNFLKINPLDNQKIVIPKDSRKKFIQSEAEICILCDMKYENNYVTEIVPNKFTVFNDASTRVKKNKLSEKKNWGKSTQGISEQWIKIDSFDEYGQINNYNLIAYLRRGGDLFQYTLDAPIHSYSYIYQQLIDWIVDRLNNQQDKDILENISEYIDKYKPSQALIAIGAINYTDFGLNNFLIENDEIIIIAYDRRLYKSSEIHKFIETDNLKDLLYLKQVFIS